MRFASYLYTSTLIALLAGSVLAQDKESNAVLYNRDVRPILSNNCFSCHGPDSAARKGDLRLDQREAAVASAAITPNKPEASSVIERSQEYPSVSASTRCSSARDTMFAGVAGR